MTENNWHHCLLIVAGYLFTFPTNKYKSTVLQLLKFLKWHLLHAVLFRTASRKKNNLNDMSITLELYWNCVVVNWPISYMEIISTRSKLIRSKWLFTLEDYRKLKKEIDTFPEYYIMCKSVLNDHICNIVLAISLYNIYALTDIWTHHQFSRLDCKSPEFIFHSYNVHVYKRNSKIYIKTTVLYINTYIYVLLLFVYIKFCIKGYT